MHRVSGQVATARSIESGLRTRRIAKIVADAQHHGGIDKVIEEKFVKPLSTLV